MEEFTDTLEANLDTRRTEPQLTSVLDREVIPRRLGHLHLSRRLQRFMIDVRLHLRRIAYSASIDVDLRMDWQRWMHRTRLLDEELKDLFANGIETPDGGRFGGRDSVQLGRKE